MDTPGALHRVLIIDDDCSLLEAYTVLLEADFQKKRPRSTRRLGYSGAPQGRCSSSS
jgi:hypothetical protein